ncbi:Dual specificity protein phosphatase 10 [Gamsiella multidivaricata]|nr:Dual specificity protein phosphatase 10 [Gamsiella multidivaricata]
MSGTSRQRPISSYFADFSAECGTASPYTKEPVCVLPHLYLGAEHNAMDVNTLSRLGITAVLNVAIEISSASQQQYELPSPTAADKKITVIGGDKIVKTMHGGSIHYKNLSWTHHQRNLQSEFPMAFAFIEDVKSMGGKVLVHCQLGVSRSASLVIAYVMKTLQLSLTDAYEYVKSHSSVISPNMSLMYQLAEFGKSLNKSTATFKDSCSARDDDDDDEDGYPYPTDRMDIDGEENSKRSAIVPKSEMTPARSVTMTTKRSTLVLARSNSRSVAPLNSDALNGAAPPRTPLADRFTFSSTKVPSTPMTDRFSFPSEADIPSTPLNDRFSFPDLGTPSTPIHPLSTRSSRLAQRRFPEGVPFKANEPLELSPPVPSFVASHRPPSSASSSMSSVAASTSSYSRPSSTSSSASSAAMSIFAPEIPAMPLTTPAVVTSMSEASAKDETASMKGRGGSGLWSKLPLRPAAPTRTNSGSSASSIHGASSSKKAGIHKLAKVLTRGWSNGFHGCQQQQQQQQQQIECLTPSSDVAMQQQQQDTCDQEGIMEGTEGACSCSTQECVFSPRPCSPPLLDTKNFGEFYQALRMER